MSAKSKKVSSKTKGKQDFIYIKITVNTHVIVLAAHDSKIISNDEQCLKTNTKRKIC